MSEPQPKRASKAKNPKASKTSPKEGDDGSGESFDGSTQAPSSSVNVDAAPDSQPTTEVGQVEVAAMSSDPDQKAVVVPSDKAAKASAGEGSAPEEGQKLVPHSVTGCQPNAWELFLVGEKCHPIAPCFLFFSLGWLFTLAFLMKASSEGLEIFSFDASDVKSDLLVQQSFAFEAARGEEQGCSDEAHNVDKETCEADEACEWSTTGGQGSRGRGRGGDSKPIRCMPKNLCPGPEPRKRESPMVFQGGAMWINILYEAQDGGNILDDDILEYIRRFEQKLLTDVDGAELKDGTASAWDKDWCRLTYPQGGPRDVAGRCAAPNSIVNLFSMTEEGRKATEEQVKAGFSYGGVLSCGCTDVDALCGMCSSDLGLKGYNATTGEVDMNDWPADIRSCVNASTTAAAAAAAEAEAAASTGGSGNSSAASNEMCKQGVQGAQGSDLGRFLSAFCASRPSCQWAPPRSSPACSSTALYPAKDISRLVTGAQKKAVLDKMCDESNSGWQSLRKEQLPPSFDCKAADRRTSFGRTTFFAGETPLAGEDGALFESDYVLGPNGWFVKESQLESEIESESEGKLRVILFSAATIRSQYLSLLAVDGLLSFFSLVSVWLYMWWSIESAFLASIAMFEIVFSVPVALCMWTIVLQQKIQWFQFLTLYMILGIGADDAFILNDAWLQSRFVEKEVSGDWKTRFAWAYRRAFKAMLITTATTCGSFLIGVASPLPQVQAFSVFAAVVVLVDWLFCITLFASAIMVRERYLKSSKDPGECCGPGFCCGLTMCIAGKYCTGVCGPLPKADAPPEKRALEKFCEGRLFEFLKRWRLALIAGWLLFILSMLITAAAVLRTAEKAAPLGRESEDAIRGTQILLEEFSIFGVPTTSFVYGLHPEEPIEWGDASDEDAALYSAAEAAKVASPSGQMELLRLCRAADLGEAAATKATRCQSRDCLILGRASASICPRNEELYSRFGVYMNDDILCENGRYCFMEDFARYWAFHIAGAACKNQTSSSCGATDGCEWKAEFSTCSPTTTEDDYPGLPTPDFLRHLASEEYAAYLSSRETALNANGREFDDLLARRLTGFKLSANKKAMQMAWVSFNATYPAQNSVEQANGWYDRWEEFRTDHGEKIGGFQTTDLYRFMVTQNEMVKAAVMGIMLSLVMAFMVLIAATRNWWVALVGLGNIAGISIVFMGIIPIIGWSLGENECIFMIAVVGLSVDYTVHLLHVYDHSESDDRLGRSRDALSEMGISVLNSALTTLLAASILFACRFYFFIQFGGFIFIVIMLSIAMSISFLMPMLMVIGPQGKQGRIDLRRRIDTE